MPLYEYECKNGHRVELIIPLADFTERVGCVECYKKNGRVVCAKLVPSRTGTPILKKGCGGFYKSNA